MSLVDQDWPARPDHVMMALIRHITIPIERSVCL
jgi:hypothetical protein